MPYVVSPGSILAVSFEGLLYGQQVITTNHYVLSGETPEDGGNVITEMGPLIDGGAGSLYGAYRLAISQDVIDLAIFMQWITPNRYAYRTFVPANQDGAIASEAGAPNIAQVVTRRGELAIRRAVSNLHLPGIPQNGYSGGFLEFTQLTLLEEFGQASVNQIPLTSGNTMKPVAFHRANPTLSEFLITQYGQPTVREMRRRTVGLGS